MLTAAKERLRSPSERLRLAIVLFGVAVLGMLWTGLFYEREQSTARAVRQAESDTATRRVQPDGPPIGSAGSQGELGDGSAREQRFMLLLGIGLSILLIVPLALLLREVSRGRKRENAMAAQASLLRTIVDVSPAAVWVKDAEGRFEMINDATAHVMGHAKHAIIGRRTADLLPAETAENIEEWDRTARLRPGITIGGAHSTVYGGERHHLLTFRRSCDVGGRPLLVGAAVDVTSLRRAEEALHLEIKQREAAEAELRQAQKMEAIGKLTGGVAHDFNNLLTSVQGNLELARRRVRDTDVLRLLGNAERAAEHGAELIQHLLAFSRKQRLEALPLDLNRLIVGMRDLMEHAIGATVRIETRPAAPLWPALADANQVEAAILNIAINARDAMPEGGELVIATANIAAGSPDLPSELPQRDYVAVTITDTGTGMTQDILVKAFDPFFTTKAVGKGSGLGLSQVYGMTRQSGGTATIESTPGRGTAVCLYLPRALEAAPRERATRRAPPRPRHTGATILVVDDDVAVRDFVAAALREVGHQVAVAQGGHEAIATLTAQTVDLLVVDLLMPEMTGAELARLARERQPDIAILLITGFADAQAARSPEDGPILMKPFRGARLIAEVDALLQGRGFARAKLVKSATRS